MRLPLQLFLLGAFLTGCTNSLPNPAPTPTTYKPITSTTTAIATYTGTPTPTITTTAAVQEIKITSNNDQTRLEGFLEHVNSLAWSEDGKTLIIASQQNYLVFFDVQRKKVTVNPVSDTAISSIALSPDKKMLAVNSAESLLDTVSVRFISLETGDVVKTIKVERTPIFEGKTRIAYGGTGIFAPSGEAFILNTGKQITLWDVASGNQIQELFNCDSNYFVSGLFLNPAKNLLFTMYYKQFEWDKEKTFLGWNTIAWELTNTFSGDFSGFSFSPDGNTFVPRDAEIYILDSNSLTELLNSTGAHNLGLYGRGLIAYDPSGKYFATGGLGDYVTIYNASTEKPIRQLSAGFAKVLEFSPDGTKLAAGGGYERPGVVTIWDLSQP